MEHGGDIYSYQEGVKGEILDFSSNINPLGPPEGLKDFLMEGFGELMQYPDISYRDLRGEIAQYLGCPLENTIAGNGAVEIIDGFILDADRVVLMEPCFSEYGLRAWIHGKEIEVLSSGEDLGFDPDIFRGKIIEGDLVILGNPNNPTGLRIKEEHLLDIYRQVEECGAYLLLDEAFHEFAPEDYDSINIFRDCDYHRVGIIRAATKFFALPGIRLGYGCAEPQMAEKIRNTLLPWSVNSMANRSGLYIFKDRNYVIETKEYLEVQRRELMEGLSGIEGLCPYPSQSNYILIKLDGMDEDTLFDKLIKEGIMVRKCRSFKVLSDNHIRVAVKDQEKNGRLLEALERIMEEERG